MLHPFGLKEKMDLFLEESGLNNETINRKYNQAKLGA